MENFNTLPEPEWRREMELMMLITGSMSCAGIDDTLKKYNLYDDFKSCGHQPSINYEILKYKDQQKGSVNWEELRNTLQLCSDIVDARYEILLQVHDIMRNEQHPMTDNKIQEINNEAQNKHNIELRHNRRVYHLFNDGRIEYTKGGHVYLSSKSRMVHPQLNHIKDGILFPITEDDRESYAVVTLEDAERIREMMKR